MYRNVPLEVRRIPPPEEGDEDDNEDDVVVVGDPAEKDCI